jgi:hypothetical protein
METGLGGMVADLMEGAMAAEGDTVEVAGAAGTVNRPGDVPIPVSEAK